MNLIALVGFIGSGKDTVGRYLVEEHGFYDMAFADALKDTCAAIFHWDREMLDGKNPQSREWRNQVDAWWAERLGIPEFTPRWALQNIGTETLRRHFRDDLWILNVERRLTDMVEQHGPDARIVLTDGRFPNELEMVRRLGGRVARVRRGPEPDFFHLALQANLAGNQHARETMLARSIHISEWAWIGYPVDHHIENDSTLDALFARASELLKA